MKKERLITLFILVLLIWIFAIIGLIWGTVVENKASQIMGIIGSPLISQLVGMWPKIIHYRKVKKEISKVEKLHQSLVKYKTEDERPRNYFF